MLKGGPKSLSELMSDTDSPIKRLIEEAHSRIDLAEVIRAGLPELVGQHLESCNLRDDGTLVILASTPEWAARLRFESDAMLSRCRKLHPGAARIKIRVRI